jgi:hypothetical protein
METGKFSNSATKNIYPLGGDCSNLKDYTFGGQIDVWGWGAAPFSPAATGLLYGSELNTTDFYVTVQAVDMTTETMYVDSISVTVYFEQETNNTTQYIKSGGASGAWTNDANVEGAPDASCMSSATTGQEETCYPVQFSGIDNLAPIHGIEVIVKRSASSSGTDKVEASLYSTSKGATSYKAGALITDTANCAAVANETFGSSADLWGWEDSIALTGADINGTDFYVKVKHTGSNTVYVDSIQVIIYHAAKYPTSTSSYIKSGGASGPWTNDANAEGSPDSSCMSTSGSFDIEALYPTQFTGIGDGDRIYGIKVDVKWSCSSGSGDGIGVRLYCTSKGNSNNPSSTSTPSANCAASTVQTFGGFGDTWRWGELVGKDINGTDFRVDVTTLTNGPADTYYVDSVEITIYYEAVRETIKYIKTGGATGDFVSDSNMEGTADSTCATTAVVDDEETLYPVQFTEIQNTDHVFGIKVEVKLSHDGVGFHDFDIKNLYTTSLGASEAGAYGGWTLATSNCAASAWDSEPDQENRRWWPNVHTIGDDFNGTDFYFIFRHSQLSGGGTVYVDAARVTIYSDAASGTTYYVYPAAGVGANGVIVKDITKSVDAGIGANGSVLKDLKKVLSAGIGTNAAASAIKIVYVYVAAGIGAAATLTKDIGKKVSAGVGTAATLTKDIGKKVSAGIGAAATFLKNMKKKVSAGVGTNAVATALRTAYINISAGVGTAATIVKNIKKTIAAGVGANAAGTALRKVFIFASAGVGAAATIVKDIKKAIAVGVGANAAATALKTVYVNIAAGVGASATVLKDITKTLAAGVGASAVSTALRTVYINISAGVGAAATVIKNIKKKVSAGVGANAAATALKLVYIFVSAGVGAAATTVKDITKALSAGVGAAGTVVKNIKKKVSAGVGANSAATALKKVYIYVSAGVGAAATTLKNIKKTLAAGVGANAAVTALKTIYLYLSAGVGAAATTVKNVTKALSAGVGAAATITKSITKALAAGVGASASGIATKIGGALKYIYASAGVGTNASATALRTAYLNLAAGVGAAATTAKSITKSLSAGVGTAAVTIKSITKALSAGVGANAAVTAFKSTLIAVAAGVGAAATSAKSITKTVSAGVGAASTITKSITKRISAGVGVSATAFWQYLLTHILRAVLSFQSLFAQVSKTGLRADLDPGGGLKAVLSTVGVTAADSVSDALTVSDGAWYDGFWGTDLQGLGGSVTLEGTEKTAGSYSIKYNPPGGNNPFSVYYALDSEIDFTNVDVITFDIKSPVGGSCDFSLLDFDFWSVYYDITLVADGEWHTYEVPLGSFYDADDLPTFAWDRISTLYFQSWAGNSPNPTYVDNIKFKHRSRLRATITLDDGLKATID